MLRIHMRNTLFISMFFWFFSSLIMAQDTKNDYIYDEESLYEDDPYFWSNTKEICVNITGLASKFIPFNLGENSAGNVAFMYKKYYSKKAFRFSLGARSGPQSFDSELPSHLYLGVGIERRYPVSKNKKFTYSSFWDLAMSVQSDGSSVEEDGFLGVIKGYGFDYHVSKRIQFGTNASLLLGINPNQDSALKIEFVAPEAVFLSVRLY